MTCHGKWCPFGASGSSRSASRASRTGPAEVALRSFPSDVVIAIKALACELPASAGVPLGSKSPHEQQATVAHIAHRQRLDQAHGLRRKGWKKIKIAQHLKIGRQTVTTYLQRDAPSDQSRRQPRAEPEPVAELA